MKTSGGLVCQGVIDGENGKNGYNAVAVPLYRRSSSELNDGNRPSGTLTYTFSTGKLTGPSSYFNGWSQNIPTASANTKLYVIMAVARSQSDTDEIAASDWSTPVEYVADGMNSAPVFIYKRAESVSDKPANGAVYTFATGVLAGTLNGWSTNIPATDNNHYPCWVRQAMAVSRDTTDVINASEWSDATKLVEDGAPGSPGGNTATIFLYRRSNAAITTIGTTLPTLYYKFSTKRLYTDAACTTLFTGQGHWYQDIPSGTAKIYVTTAVAYSTTDVDAIGGNEWVSPVQFTENGSQGDHGINTATIFLYKRSSGNITTHGINTKLYYKFADGKLYNNSEATTEVTQANLNYWSRSVPADDGTPCYIIQASALSNSDTDDIATSDWSTPVKYVKDGEKGDDAQYIYLKGSAFNKDSGGTNIVNSEIRVNGGNNLATQSRGLCLVTLNRQTLAVVDSATIYDTYYETTGKNNLITKLNSLGTNVFVCLVSYDAIGWSDTLISTLQSFGMSDLPYTSANRYPFLFIGYKNLGKGNGITRMNDMAEPAIPVELGVYVANGALSVKDGEDGDDAVTYDIVLNTAWAKVDSSGSITAGLAGTAYKIVGSTRSVLTSTTIRYGYILNDSTTYADTTTDGGGNFDAGTWFNGDYQDEYAKGSNSIFAAIIIDGSVKCVKYVTIANKGDKGDTGRMYYIAGEFPKKAPYSRTSKLCPVVYFGTKWWYLDVASATASDIPSDSSNKWKELQNYGVVLTDAIFVKQFAQFGAAIITGDWLISCHGTIGGVAYGGSVENPDQYNNRAAYTYFDPVYPQGYDPFQLPVTNDEIDRGYNTQWTKITDNFILEAGTYKFKIRCYVNSSDGMHLRLFYGDETGEGYYLQGVTNEEPVTYEIEKTLDSTRNDWNIRAGMNENGEVGYIVSVEIEPADARFVPNYAVDLKTGRSYQSDAHIKGTITSVGPNTKVVIGDGIMEFFGKFDFPNIVVGVDADGCAILNFYDKSGKFKYGLGPDKIIETLSQAESMKLTYYNVDTGSNDSTALLDSDYVAIYLYTYKNQSPASAKCLYKYLAKISANVYGGNYVNNDDAQGKKFNGKIIKQDYSIPLQDSNIYTGGIVMSSSRVQCGMTSYLSNMLSGTSYEELDYRGYDVMKDGDFNVNKDGYVYRFVTKDPYNPTEAFYIDRSYYNEGVGYSGVYADKYHLNLCTDPEYDDKLIDPIYWFNLICINSEGVSLGVKTLYINRSKLKRLLQDAGYSL